MKTPIATSISAALIVAAGQADALPPIWESDLGSQLFELQDSSESERVAVKLPTPFAFAGETYDRVFVYVGGKVTLGSDDELACCPEPSDLLDAEPPVIGPFWTDLSTEDGGAIFALVENDRLVVTWSDVRSDSNEDQGYAFQAQLLSDGTIVFGFDRSLPLGDDALNAELVVGVTDAETPGSEWSFSTQTPFSTSSPTVFQSFEENETGFPLGDRNVVFTPNGSGGFDVTAERSAPPEPCSPADLAEPFGELDIADVTAFLEIFGEGC